MLRSGGGDEPADTSEPELEDVEEMEEPAAEQPPPEEAAEDGADSGAAAESPAPPSHEPEATPDAWPEPAPQQPMRGGDGTGWAELVKAQHGERSAAEAFETVPQTAPETAPETAPLTEPASPTAPEPADISDLRGQVSAISDEMKAGISGFVEDLRSSIRGTSESAQAEIDRVAEELRSQLQRVEEGFDSQTERISDHIGRIDDRLAEALERLDATAHTLRERLDSTDAMAARLKEDVQELALRIERGLADSSDRIASVADGLETSLGSRIASTGSTAREDNTRLARELESLGTKTAALEALLHNVLDGLEAEASPRPEPVKTFSGTLQLNSATFEQLRGLGFSVTQSARIIAYRDTHGGFESMDQLREVRGLAQEDLNLLSQRATL